MPPKIGIGAESFRDIRVNQCELVDKTRMIEQLCDELTKVLLLPRPRRFGKTFNLSMLYEFFAMPMPLPTGKLADPPARELFRGLYLENVWEKVSEHFQRYPTLVLNFKGMRFTTSEQWWEHVRERLASVAQDLLPLFGPLQGADKAHLDAIQGLTATPSQLSLTLQKFTYWAYRHTGQKAVVLIDEYDAPIQDAWVMANEHTDDTLALLPTDAEQQATRLEQRQAQRLYQEVIAFFRTFFGNGLKTNDSLHKAVLTGILRVAKESLFSGFNNLKICTMMEAQFSNAFGFTEAEVQALFERQEQLERLEDARRWYNGYRFGPHIIYNPWSVTNFLEYKPPFAKPYWLNTSENALIKQLLKRATSTIGADFETLLHGGYVCQTIHDAMSLGELARDREGLFNLLFWSGYLRADVDHVQDDGQGVYRLSIPNREVRLLFRDTFKEPLKAAEARGGLEVKTLTHAILTGNDKVLHVLLARLMLHLMSYLDGDVYEPEAYYQGFMLGLCAWLEGDYKVRSNRETGLGRADLLILPRQPGRPGALLELKATREGRSLDAMLREGERQLKKRLYATELEGAGATPLYRWVVAFDGKVLKLKKLKPEG